MIDGMSRRGFLGTVMAAAAVGSARVARGQAAAAASPAVCVFSKHLQFMDVKMMAEAVKGIGLDGIDLTVRKGGHVTPDKLDGLKRAADIIRGSGLQAAMATTNLNDGADPDAGPILKAVSESGIPFVRVGGLQYAGKGDPAAQVEGFAAKLKSLAALAETYNVTLGYHNHSGVNNFGAGVWDLYRGMELAGSARLGSNFDAGHAVVEGAYGVWQVTSRLMAPRVKMMSVKDFVWNRNKPRWVPLGEGIVPLADVLKPMREAGFSGPISIHIEYDVPDPAMLEEFKRAGQVLRKALASAGYAV